ncbi:esterase [Nakamurella antarctica]|uniref:Esterase n=1 Tax=Nakamurella antarctica TaxID=1902245 RepID=A0A3G8ZKR3_9ACTN|nr:alpha/beta hydrolase-fold protein [Nakamurella antarctica]AZI57768.1 esterase [Nakamurella antarctica]
MTNTEYHRIDSPSIGGTREIVVHGHYGRPILVFPSENGSAHEFASQGLLDAVRPSVDAGRIKIFCVPSYDGDSWSRLDLSLLERGRAHRRFEDWVIWQVVPFIWDHCGGRADIATFGPSMGAYHAVLFALRHAHIFNAAVGLSGNYNPCSWRAWGEESAETYDLNPIQFVSGLHGAHLDHLRSRLELTLVVGSGMWEDSTGALASTQELGYLLASKQFHASTLVWGQEWPHDWPSWHAQAALYLPSLG